MLLCCGDILAYWRRGSVGAGHGMSRSSTDAGSGMSRRVADGGKSGTLVSALSHGVSERRVERQQDRVLAKDDSGHRRARWDHRKMPIYMVRYCTITGVVWSPM